MSGGHIHVIGYLIVPPEKSNAFRTLLTRHKSLSLQDEGCLRFEVQQSNSEPTRFNVDEIFETRVDFDRHVARVKSSEWWRFTQDFQRHYEIHSGEVNSV